MIGKIRSKSLSYIKRITFLRTSYIRHIGHQDSAFAVIESSSKRNYTPSSRSDNPINATKDTKAEKDSRSISEVSKKSRNKVGTFASGTSVTNRWSRLELRVLESLVDKYGQDWNIIAKHMLDKSPSDCRDQYLAMISMLPDSRRLKEADGSTQMSEAESMLSWTEEEIKLLDSLLTKYGRRWVTIAKNFPSKSISEIEKFVNRNPNKFSSLFKFPNRSIRSRMWSEGEIKLLNELLLKFGKNYDVISKYLRGRTPMAVLRALPKHYLELPVLRNGKTLKWFKVATRWTERETNSLNDLVEQYGDDWNTIADNLPGRTPYACKIKYKECWNFTNNKSELVLHKWPQELVQILDLIISKYGKWQILPILLPGITPMKCQLNNFCRNSLEREEWLEEEKILLKNLVKKFGIDMKKINYHFPLKEKSSIRAQIRANPEYYGLDKIMKSKESDDVVEVRREYTHSNRWTISELKKLLDLQKEYDSNWIEVAEHLPGRTPSACYLRYIMLTGSNSIQNWPIRDIICVIELFQKYGPDWELISQHFYDRSPSDIEQLVSQTPVIYTDLGIYKRELQKWTQDDVSKLRNLFGVHGEDWQTISDYFPGKTQEDCMEYFYSNREMFSDKNTKNDSIFPRRNRRMWTELEVKLLKDLIKKYGRDFNRISKFLPERSSFSIKTYIKQNKEALFPQNNRSTEKVLNWTENEESKLISLVRLYGADWKQISNYLPNRSPDACKRKYYTILHPEVPYSRYAA
ncbi:12824_t:CDS:1 [Acaulospora morrowiae]|uniref:12824_t:CDS:1 n=1 Tax=Acaulospora morrowiae TaxID=94023 RepID=A0A9N9AIW6_9GLOM|nr:12824_t:CDS:1 [Acaulospora morrowiae]